MKQTFYTITNISGSVGEYLYNDDYIQLYPRQEVTLPTAPTAHTANLKISMYRKEVSEPEVLRKKKSK